MTRAGLLIERCHPMALTATPRKRRSLWIQGAIGLVVIVVLALIIDWPAVADSFLNFDVIPKLFPTIIFPGLVNTLLYTATSFVFGLTLGLVLALMKMATFKPYQWIATVYIEFFRGIPALLVLIGAGALLPIAFQGLKLPLWATVMVALGMVSAAYMAETLRAGLQAVPKGQIEAARSLGMSHTRAMVTIVIPQAFRIVLPPLTNEVILLTKDSSLVYVLGMQAINYDITKIGRDGMITFGGGATAFVVAGLLYLVITVPLSMLARWFERRSEQNSQRTSRKEK